MHYGRNIMAKVSSGLSLSTNYFMRNYYANNRDVIKNSGRNDYTKIELSFEDSRALTRASKRLLNNDYGSETDEKDNDISDTTRSSIEAFVTTYNNAIDSSKTTDSHDTKRYLKQLKSLTSKYSSELSEIGITVERSGKLTDNEDLLKTANNSKVRKIFSPDQEYSKKAYSICGKFNNAVRDDIVSQINGKGLHINIAL